MQRAQQRGADLGRTILFEFQPDRRAFAAVVEFILDRLEQIVRVFFVDVQPAVAGDPEMPVAEDPCAGEQIGQVMSDETAEEHIVLRRIVARQFHQSRQDARHLHHGEVAQPLAALRHFQLHHHVQRLVQQLRERMRRVDRQRREHRAHLGAVIALNPPAVGLPQLGELQETDGVFSQRRHQVLAPAGVLLLHHSPDPFGDRPKRLARRQAVQAPLHHVAFDLLLQPGDADLEKFVEIRAGDAEKFHPLQQRRGGVQRFVEHALVELQPAQLAIDEVGRPEGCCRHRHSPETPV